MAIVASHVAAVQELYVAYFNRPADVAGLDYWTNIVAANNGATAAVSATFATSPEYTSLFTGLTNAQIVDKIYSNMFGRGASTTDGREFWVNLLNEGKVTVSAIVAEVANGAQGTDSEAVENKVAAATAFTAALDTPAEQAGYAGPEALALAKAFISSVTTDASLNTALAPATLDATVAGVVSAGTPFTLAGGLSNLVAAQDAITDFLATLDLDSDGSTTDTTRADVTTALNGAVTATTTALNLANTALADPAVGIIGSATSFATASTVVRAALIEEARENLADALAQERTDLATAMTPVNAVAGLAAAIDQLGAAEDNFTAANNAATLALAARANAEVAYEVRAGNNTDITIGADGAVANLITINPTTGAASLATGVTEATNPGVGALLTAIRANITAQTTLAQAADAVTAAELEVGLLDRSDVAAETSALNDLVAELVVADVGTIASTGPTAAQVLLQQQLLEQRAAAETTPGAAAQALTDFNAALDAFVNLPATTNPRATAVANQAAIVEGLEDRAAALEAAVAGYETAAANSAQLVTLDAAVTAARAAFTANDFAAPVTLNASAVGTSASDIFVLGTAATTIISGFGRAGADSLYIGSDYTLNTGALSTGDNTKLEVFFVANASGVRIHVETEVYGSDSAAVPEQVITLTGVAASDLVFDNGIISLRGAA